MGISLGKQIIWGGSDPFTHLLCVGPTRCGKTSTVILPIIYQLLIQKKSGKKLGISVIEPKGDLAQDVKQFCDVMEIPYTYIDPDSDDSHHFNVMEGNTDDVAEATVAVLQSLFGKQEAFFQTIQELSTRNITKLLKELHGNDMDLLDVLITLRSPHILEKKVAELKQRQGQTDLVEFFENELLGSLSEKYRQLVIGLRAQLENITGNTKLRKIITGKSDINIDQHFEDGGILIVNTALGSLKKAGDAFGQFITMHLQSGTFRRKGSEQTRTPHFMIIDEYSRYINPDVEMFLSIAASYRVSGIFATQSLGQLEVESGKIGGKAMKQAILTSCRNKIAFCGLSAQDAKEFAEEFGKDQVIMRQSTYRNRILLPRFFPDTYRDTESEQYRYHYTYLQDEMKRFHFICRVLNDGTPQRPVEGIGSFIPRNWQELREWEIDAKDNNEIQNVFGIKKGLNGLVKKKKKRQIDAISDTTQNVITNIKVSTNDSVNNINSNILNNSKIEYNNITDNKNNTKNDQKILLDKKPKALFNIQEDEPVSNETLDSQNKKDLEFNADIQQQRNTPDKNHPECNNPPRKGSLNQESPDKKPVVAAIKTDKNDLSMYNDDDFW